MKEYEVVIKGVAPGLLMHKFGAEAQGEMEKQTKKVKVDQGSAQAQAEACAYRGSDGRLFQPAEHVFQALRKAAAEFQVKGRGKKTYKDAVSGNLLVEPEYIPHGTDRFEIDSRPVRIQRARIVRHRPFLPSWSLAFTLRVLDEDALPGEVLNAILVKAGACVGIGDYRPRFGRFIVERFTENGSRR